METKLLLSILPGMIVLTILLTSLSLAKFFETPENPGSNVILAVTFKDIPKVDPFPVAIALIIEMAPNTVDVDDSFFNLFWFTKNSK